MRTCCARLLPGAVVDICYPADPGANLPIGGLEGYDGVAITGSALNVYDGGPEIAPQIELAREVLKSQDAAVRQLLGPAGHHRRGRRHGAGEPEGPRDRHRATHRADAGRPRPSDVCRQGVGVRRRHGASRRGRDARARHHGAGGERAVRRAGGRDQGRRRGRVGRAVSSGVFARRHGGDHAALRAAAGRAKASSPTRRRATPMWPTSRRSTASRTTSRSPGATASTRRCSTAQVRTAEIANWITHQVLPARAATGRGCA